MTGPTVRRVLPAQVLEAMTQPAQVEPVVSWRDTVSTGSLLLDLAISGGRTRYGGLPGGILVEVFGMPSMGKTTILAETIGNAQRLGGEVRIKDPEARLDAAYCKLMGVRFDPSWYSCPDTVTDVVEGVIGPLAASGQGTKRDTSLAWCPDPSHINVEAVDSLAALSTRLEMESGDKMGQRRAKEFSEGLRLVCRHIQKHNILFLCSNQVRENVEGFGESYKSPGGMAIPFYSSCRVRLREVGKLRYEVAVGKIKERRPYGVEVEAYVYKSSLDAPHRTALLRIIYGYGIDDIGANLQWLKDRGAWVGNGEISAVPDTSYAVGGKRFRSLERAVKAAEEGGLEVEIREQVVALWQKIEGLLPKRQPKRRLCSTEASHPR